MIERKHAGIEHVHDDPKRPYVRTFLASSHNLFRRHIGPRTGYGGGKLFLLEFLGCAKIQKLYEAVRSDHDIRRFYIPVNYSQFVGIRHNIRQLNYDGLHLFRFKLPFNHFIKGFPRHKLLDEHFSVLNVDDLTNFGNTFMIVQPAQYLGFLLDLGVQLFAQGDLGHIYHGRRFLNVSHFPNLTETPHTQPCQFLVAVVQKLACTGSGI